jgi:hypothetical protein
MKIGEALLERDHLNGRLDALESRLRDDAESGRPLTHILEEMQVAANRVLDLQNCIDWTLQHLTVEGKALGTYVNKSDHMQRLADLLETSASPEMREKADDLHEAKKSTDVLIQTIYWAYDLQIPATVSEEPEEDD